MAKIQKTIELGVAPKKKHSQRQAVAATVIKKLFDNSSDGLILLGNDFQTIYSNPAARRITGWPETGPSSYSIRENVYKPDQESLLSVLHTTQNSPGAPISFTYRSKHNSGNYIWLGCTFTNELNDPDLAAIVLNFKDVSDKIALKEELEKTKKELSTYKYALDESAIVAITDQKGIINYVNDTFCRISQFSEAELIGRDHRIISSGYHEKSFIRELWQTIASGKTWKGEFKNKAKDGSYYWVDATVVPFLNDKSKPYQYVAIRFDITQRKNAEAALMKSEKRFRALVENNSDGIMVLNSAGKPLYISPSCHQISGYTTEEAMKLNVIDIMHPDDLIHAYSKLAECLSKPGIPIKNITYKMRHKNGGYRYLESTLSNFIDDPAIGGIINNFRDITQATLDYQALEQLKNELEKIMSSSLDLICIVDENGHIKQVSPSSEIIIGFAPGEMISRKITDFVHPDDKQKTKETAHFQIEGNDIRNFENRYIHKNGSVVNLSWSSKWDDMEKLAYGIARDVSGRKQHENELLESEKKYKDLFEHNPTPLFLWDFETYTFIDCNNAAVKAYGYTREEFLRLTLRDLKMSDDLVQFQQIIETKETHGPIHRGTWKHRKKNGDIMLVEVEGHLMEYKGRTASLSIIKDITQSHYNHELDELEKELLTGSVKPSRNLSEIITIYLAGIERLHAGAYFSLLEIKNNRLYVLAGQSFPQEIVEKINGISVGIDSAPCGQAAYLKESVIVPDIARSGISENFKKIAHKTGIKSCWSHPVMDGENKVMATFECFYKSKRVPSDLEKNTIARATNILKVILESNQYEAALRASNERFERATQATSDVIWEWDIETDTMYYSSNFKKQFGHEAGTYKNSIHFFTAHVHPDDIDKAILPTDKVKLGTMTGWLKEYRFKKCGGEFAFIRDRAIVIRDQNGIATRAIGSMQDITKQQQEEQQLRLLESVVTNTNDAVLISEAKSIGISGPRILYVNEAFTKMTGYSADEIVGKTPEILLGPNTDKAELKRLAEAIDRREAFEGTVINYRKNGEEYWKSFSLVPVIGENNLCNHIIGIERDVTHQKNAELRLKELNDSLNRQAKALAISNAELEQFAYVASHDLQEPLRMVNSFMTLFEKKYSDTVDDKGKQYIHFAVDGAARMRQIILDLLDFSRIGHMGEDLEVVDFNLLMDDILALYQESIKEEHARIVIDHLPTLETYKTPLRQVFQNLVSNSLKYHRPGVPPVIHVTCKETKSHYQFSVKDEGLGIDSEYFDKIFVIFQRLHNKDEYSGTGIGLAIVKKIIDKMGGEIWIKSAINKGSTFNFSLPRAVNN